MVLVRERRQSKIKVINQMRSMEYIKGDVRYNAKAEVIIH